MEDCVNNNPNEIHIDSNENDIENNWDTIQMVIEEFPDDQYDDKEKKYQRIRTTVLHRDNKKMKRKLKGIPMNK